MDRFRRISFGFIPPAHTRAPPVHDATGGNAVHCRTACSVSLIRKLFLIFGDIASCGVWQLFRIYTSYMCIFGSIGNGPVSPNFIRLHPSRVYAAPPVHDATCGNAVHRRTAYAVALIRKLFYYPIRRYMRALRHSYICSKPAMPQTSLRRTGFSHLPLRFYISK